METLKIQNNQLFSVAKKSSSCLETKKIKKIKAKSPKKRS